MESSKNDHFISLIWKFVIVLSINHTLGLLVSQETTKEVCVREEFTPRCNYDEVILITRALFGHIHMGRCAPRDFGQFGCYSDVYEIMDAKCSLHQKCSVSPLDDQLANSEPECAVGLVTFLETSYVCIKGSVMLNICDKLTATHIENFFLTSRASKSTCSADNRYINIASKQGQQIEINALDVVKNFTTHFGMKIIDEGVERHFDIVQHERKHAQYTSISSEVTLTLDDTESNYIITYKGKWLPIIIFIFQLAIGCLDIQIPSDAIAEKEGDRLSVRCQYTSQSWNLKCIGTRWIGTIGTCAPTTVLPPLIEVPDYVEIDNNDVDKERSGFSKGMVLGIIVTATILLCVCVVGVGGICAKSMKRKYLPNKDYEKCELVAVDGTIARMLRSSDVDNTWQNTLPQQQTIMRNEGGPIIAIDRDNL
ncbi:hypothetical protein CAPTEDRAFT_211534 [Capitella teleta]|uniref:SUEL-type lectin domain-containing protein n=1 Tax=Capitella teleta TaxID=283909 RepID=R7TGJ4_CAPTE|nr:hypothetical protein CAPTEDRAFT_211534 [Capitella teleta]|eukprot:ELT90696.1 hypothetical protein CAPTEDRAFT_211534 [Capitella teleta]